MKNKTQAYLNNQAPSKHVAFEPTIDQVNNLVSYLISGYALNFDGFRMERDSISIEQSKEEVINQTISKLVLENEEVNAIQLIKANHRSIAEKLIKYGIKNINALPIITTGSAVNETYNK